MEEGPGLSTRALLGLSSQGAGTLPDMQICVLGSGQSRLWHPGARGIEHFSQGERWRQKGRGWRYKPRGIRLSCEKQVLLLANKLQLGNLEGDGHLEGGASERISASWLAPEDKPEQVDLV